MLYNKRYMRLMAVSLLILLILQGITAIYAFENQLNLLLYIVVTFTIILGIVIVIFFIINGIQKDHFLKRKAVKEQETYLLNEDALLHKVSEVIELCNNYHIDHSVLSLHVKFEESRDKALYIIVDTVEHMIRKNDILFRRDNGHFVVIAYSNLDDSIQLGKKMIEVIDRSLQEHGIEANCNVGISQIKANDNKHEAILRSEKALQASMKYGTNHVEYMR